jgi:hypothetical protein
MATPEALAFDLYGTLVDPIRIWRQLEAKLSSSDGGGCFWPTYRDAYSSHQEAAGKACASPIVSVQESRGLAHGWRPSRRWRASGPPGG